MSNSFTYYFFNHNIFTFIGHNYWQKNLNNIALPQLMNCVSNVALSTNLKFFNNNYDYLIIIPSNIFILYFIKKVYKKEDSKSKNLRYIISIFLFIMKFIFV